MVRGFLFFIALSERTADGDKEKNLSRGGSLNLVRLPRTNNPLGAHCKSLKGQIRNQTDWAARKRERSRWMRERGLILKATKPREIKPHKGDG